MSIFCSFIGPRFEPKKLAYILAFRAKFKKTPWCPEKYPNEGSPAKNQLI